MELRGIDLYTYVGNNPIGGSDASGFDPGDGNSADDAHNADRDAAFYAMDHDWENPNTAYRSRYAQDRNSQLPGEGGYQKLNYVVGPVAGQVWSCTPFGAEEGAGASEVERATEEMQTLYRGVATDHAGYPDALNGEAYPRGGDATPFEHNRGNTQSEFTSWTTDPSVAQSFAGPDGVVLQKQVPVSQTVASPDQYNEKEVLVNGPVTGATVTH